MTTEKQYFTKEEMKERLVEALEHYSTDDVIDAGDLIHEVFNNDYYIVYTSEAENALENYGVFNAIREIQDYENEMFGEIHTDFSSPVDIASMLWYVLGDQYMNELELYQHETVDEILEALQDGDQ